MPEVGIQNAYGWNRPFWNLPYKMIFLIYTITITRVIFNSIFYIGFPV
jgi:hypothetical protein